MITRKPCLPLRPFIDLFWASNETSTPVATGRELVLPSGAPHLVVRLDDSRVKIFENLDDRRASTHAVAIAGGIRSTPYYKEVQRAGPVVGMQLRPGAIELVSRAPAGVLAEAHTELGALWPSATLNDLIEQLNIARSPSESIAIVESFFVGHIPRRECGHPAINYALHQFHSGTCVGDVVTETGMSHRHFLKIFAQSVGLTPKRYLRVHRFNRALSLSSNSPRMSWAGIAAEAGYADQAHLSREFANFARLSPSRYRDLSRDSAHHVRIR